jgi:hypothetical protein
MERWYHRAAVVIWSNKDHFTVLTHAGQRFAIPQLAEMLDDSPVDTGACREFALTIMDNWLWHNDRYSIDDTETLASTTAFLSVLLRLGDDSLVVEFFDAILTGDFFGTEGLAIRRACQQIGWARFADGLLIMSKQTHAKRVRAFSQILAVLSEGAEANPQQQELCLILARNALDSLLHCAEEAITFVNKEDIEKAKQPSIICLFKACYFLNQASLLEELGGILTASKKRFPLRSVVIPVIRELHQWLTSQATPNPIFNSAFLQPCLQQIQQAATLIIEEPKDWAQQVKLSCQCADCTELGQFLQNPVQQEYRFRMRQDRRDHLEREIKSQNLDISCSTERIGSPHTLVCLKNRASYFRAKEQQAIDNELWWELQQF